MLRLPRSHSEALPPYLQRYHYDELPPHLQGNPYIVRGYRAFLSHRQCVQTICCMHNEWGNIWTHLVGFVWAFCIFFRDQLYTFSEHEQSGGSSSDRYIFAAYMLGMQICMLASGLYHLFLPQAEKITRRWLSIDLLGVTLGMISGYFPGVYYGFYCFPELRQAYSIATCLIFVGNIAMQLNPKFLTEAWFYQRIGTYACTLGFGLVPVCHWMTLSHTDSEEVYLFLSRVCVTYLFMIVGVFFYISRWPERVCPGAVDYLGHSHQFWHIMVLCSLVWWYYASIECFEYRQLHPCPLDM